LGRLHRLDHTRVNRATPCDPVRKPLRFHARTEKLGDELIITKITHQRGINPVGDLLAASVNEAGALVIVSEQIIPKRKPMFGVRLILSQQPMDQLRTLARRLIRQKRLQLSGRRKEPDRIQPNPTRVSAIIDHRPPALAYLGKIGIYDSIDRML